MGTVIVGAVVGDGATGVAAGMTQQVISAIKPAKEVAAIRS